MQEKLRQSVSTLVSTTLELAARNRVLDRELVHKNRAVRAREKKIAELRERVRLAETLARLVARRQALWSELAALEDKLLQAMKNVSRWERHIAYMQQDCAQWKLLYEETKTHHQELRKDIAFLRA